MLEQNAIKKFYTVLGTMARISKVCVLRLTADHLYFILTDISAGGSPSVWCEMRQESYFNEYNIEGVSKEHNEILMEIVPDKLSKTLVSLKSATAPARSVKVKLTKKTVPCLTFEVELPGNDPTTSRMCIHDIPVTVLGRNVFKDYQEPTMPPFDVSICLPDTRKLKHLMERFSKLGRAVTITAGKQGSLSLKVESDEGEFCTRYPDVKVPVYRDDTLPWRRPDTQQDSLQEASVRVDLKRLSLFLAGETLQPKRAIANIVDREVLHMFFVHEDLLVQYFIPATSLV